MFDKWNVWQMKCLMPLVFLSETLSWSSYFLQICFIYSSFTKIFPFLNPLVQKDQRVKLVSKGHFKNSGISYGRMCLEGRNGSIFFVSFNERDREVAN